MTLAARITAGFLLLAGLLVALGGSELGLIDRLLDDNRRLAGASLEAAGLNLEMRRRVERLDEFTRKYLLLRDPGYASELRRLREWMEEAIARLLALDLEAEERRAAEELEASWRRYARAAPTWEDDPSAAGRNADPAAFFSALASDLDRLFEASRQAMDRRIAASAERAEHARTIAWGAAALALLAAAVLALVIIRSVTGPLRRLARGTDALALGDFTHRVPVEGPPELSALARDFNAMAGRLGELDRLKKDFLTAVSHDLKAPLASMAETTRLLLDRIPGELNEKQQRLLELQLKTGERLSHMISDLLDLARIEAGALELEREPLDLVALARETLGELEGSFRSAGLRVEVAFPAEPVRIDGDGDRLAQVLSNLLSNAGKFASVEGGMGVRIREISEPEDLPWRLRHGPRRLAAPVALLEVWDAGPGVPDAEKEAIFARFHRGGSTAAVAPRGPRGTGLGLAIARHLAHAHGGELWAEDRPGGGSRFLLALPVAASRRSW